MKKFFMKAVSVALVGAMGLAFAGCSGKSNGSDASQGSDASAAQEQFTIEKGKLIMATNAAFPPYEYHEGDKIVGIDAEIAEAIAKKLDLQLEIQDIEFDSIVTGVQAKKYDIGCAGMTVTEDRKQSVNFTSTYATGIQSIIVKDGSAITDFDSLKAGTYHVGVQQGTTGDIYISDELGDDRVERFNKGADAVLALSNGQVDAVVIDNEPAKSFVDANKDLKILETPYAVEEYAMCVNKENEVLLNKINAALEELKKDGTLDNIIKKYIPAN